MRAVVAREEGRKTGAQIREKHIMQAPQCCSFGTALTAGGIVKRQKEKHNGLQCASPIVELLRNNVHYANDVLAHTSSVNRLFLLPSRETGVSLLPNAAVALGVQDGVPEVAAMGFCTFDLAWWTVGRR